MHAGTKTGVGLLLLSVCVIGAWAVYAFAFRPSTFPVRATVRSVDRNCSDGIGPDGQGVYECAEPTVELLTGEGIHSAVWMHPSEPEPAVGTQIQVYYRRSGVWPFTEEAQFIGFSP